MSFSRVQISLSGPAQYAQITSAKNDGKSNKTSNDSLNGRDYKIATAIAGTVALVGVAAAVVLRNGASMDAIKQTLQADKETVVSAMKHAYSETATVASNVYTFAKDTVVTGTTYANDQFTTALESPQLKSAMQTLESIPGQIATGFTDLGTRIDAVRSDILGKLTEMGCQLDALYQVNIKGADAQTLADCVKV